MSRPSRPDAVGSFLDAIADDGETSRVRERALGGGKLIVERYRLRSAIARGGMATIWEAEDEKLGRVVAIKFMAQGYAHDPDYRKRFEEEARAAARLQTPYVVQIHDHGTTDGVPFIVMERLRGEDLHTRLQRVTRLDARMVGQIATEAGRALKIAHGAGIIHRDLKPQNLFLEQTADTETVKLLDFGVAKHAGTAAVMTQTGIMLGSPFYMSPEQIRGERDLDLRTDLWSLGAILYRALTGSKPFEGEMTEVMHKISTQPAKPPSALCPELSQAVDGFFARALARKRELRFGSAAEMMEAFRLAMKRQSGSSGVRPISLPDDVLEDFVSEAPAAEPRRALSDHPTVAAPLSVMSRLGVAAEPAPATGLRLGDAVPQLTPIPVDRETQPNIWVASAALTIEQEHGFSNPDAADQGSRWAGAEVTTDTSPTEIERPRSDRSWIYVVAGALVVMTILAMSFVLAWAFR